MDPSQSVECTWSDMTRRKKHEECVVVRKRFFFIPHENNRQVLVDREGCRGRPDVDYAHITEKQVPRRQCNTKACVDDFQKCYSCLMLFDAAARYTLLLEYSEWQHDLEEKGAGEGA